MAGKHSIELRDLVGKLDALEVRCSKCDRQGRMGLARLIEEHGGAKGLPVIRQSFARDCPRVRAPTPYDQCDVFFPQLVPLFHKPGFE